MDWAVWERHEPINKSHTQTHMLIVMTERDTQSYSCTAGQQPSYYTVDALITLVSQGFFFLLSFYVTQKGGDKALRKEQV